MLLFLAYLIRSAVAYNSQYYLQYLTNWGLIFLVAYFIWAAVAVTYTFIHVLVLKKDPHKPSYRNDKNKLDRPPGCCGRAVDSTSWYHKIQWILFNVNINFAITITFLYWVLLYDPSTRGIDDINLFTHLFNGLLSYFDLWFSGTPVRLYHMYIPAIPGICYGVFTGIHHATLVAPNITGPIYSIVDYDTSPGLASALVILVPLVVMPIVHTFVYCNYLLREGILSMLRKKCGNEEETKDEDNGINLE